MMPTHSRRDVQQQINQERIRHALQQQDRVDARQRMAAATIRRDAPPDASGSSSVDSRGPEQQQPHAQHEHHSKQQQEQQGASEGDDAELQRLREQRLRQLRAESAVKQEQRQEGFGRLNTVQESNLLVSCVGTRHLQCCIDWRTMQAAAAAAANRAQHVCSLVLFCTEPACSCQKAAESVMLACAMMWCQVVALQWWGMYVVA